MAWEHERNCTEPATGQQTHREAKIGSLCRNFRVRRLAKTEFSAKGKISHHHHTTPHTPSGSQTILENVYSRSCTKTILFNAIGTVGMDKGGTDLIAEGAIKVKSCVSLQHFTKNGLVLGDGTELCADVVVFA